MTMRDSIIIEIKCSKGTSINYMTFIWEKRVSTISSPSLTGKGVVSANLR